MDERLIELEKAIEVAEVEKRMFVKDNPNGTGDKEQRIRLYTNVEKARKDLRDYKRANPHLL